MIEKYSIRTDLALEDKERFESDNVEVQGVTLSEDYDEEREIKVTTVKIETENGAKVMRKPVGTYITMEAPNMAVPDEDYHAEISKELAKFLSRFIRKDKEDYSILVAGLGNQSSPISALRAPHAIPPGPQNSSPNLYIISALSFFLMLKNQIVNLALYLLFVFLI